MSCAVGCLILLFIFMLRSTSEAEAALFFHPESYEQGLDYNFWVRVYITHKLKKDKKDLLSWGFLTMFLVYRCLSHGQCSSKETKFQVWFHSWLQGLLSSEQRGQSSKHRPTLNCVFIYNIDNVHSVYSVITIASQ